MARANGQKPMSSGTSRLNVPDLQSAHPLGNHGDDSDGGAVAWTLARDVLSDERVSGAVDSGVEGPFPLPEDGVSVDLLAVGVNGKDFPVPPCGNP
eukprot:7948225-Heterocapsa_arctica.AAC.1